ncbi:lipoate-protein ligase A [Levilactobacillus senmaizukei DSM 21775 = NBRC 103853]|uniref:Lipoate-protein ligase A n=1 Tax=Levilactobacillus senmaizukei DSM 21775 = NBRC 103853 TaxID=1423803 RepID=A0A0R2DT66_9LACO|nr:biotin/lipoate A/B protein ligase family protein [Levilactobacillus senmaizukei]KRN03309.1 lipoate-protein ligase A [Levilactobacillus senmaizukei DSM 21775 = NBRC 103853]
MFLIDTNRHGKVVTDAVVNQSIDNYLVNDLKLPGHGLMMYVNQPAVIVGINQTVTAEVDFKYLAENRVQLVRRTSGGGAVYHDERNLIFEHIVNGDPQDGSKFGDYTVFADPILKALAEMGVDNLGISNKSALMVGDRKFSGMTMFKNGDGYAAGGTIMYDLNVAAAHAALIPAAEGGHPGVASNRVSITNLRQHLAPAYQDLSIQEFRVALLCHIFGVERLDQIETYHLTDHDWAVIDKRLAEKYATAAWNYGANPGFREYRQLNLAAGQLHVNFTRHRDLLRSVALFGTVATPAALAAIAQRLVGQPATIAAVKAILTVPAVSAVIGTDGVGALVQALTEVSE